MVQGSSNPNKEVASNGKGHGTLIRNFDGLVVYRDQDFQAVGVHLGVYSRDSSPGTLHDC